MTKVKLTNIGPVDTMVDKMGNNSPEDKIIIHPRVTVTVDVATSQLKVIRKIAKLVVVVVA